MPKLHVKPVDKKDLKLFRLVNGQHIGLDYMAEPEVVTDADGNVTGYTYPSKLYDANTGNNHVWSTTDLVKKLVNKFQAEPESGDAYRRAMRGEQRIVRTAAQQVIRADDMDRADAEVSPHNPPLDQPDVADKTRLPENVKVEGKESVKEGVKSKATKGDHPDISPTDDPHKPAVRKHLPTNLNDMSVNDLKDYAKGEEIDLKGATTKADMIRAIKSSH